MPQHTLGCHVQRPHAPETSANVPLTDVTQCPRHTLVHGIDQEVTHTASRRTGPRKWLRAVHWLIAAGLHPKANATTLRIADDLAARMDYTTGHVRYCLDETAARLGIDRSTVKRHVKYLRELGALAWVQHGTRRNIRRMLGLSGYAGTATIYAAVIPPVYDHAMGHRIVGTGYTARIVVDLRNRPTPVDTPGNPPVENPSSKRCAPPSLTGVKKENQVQVVGGVTTTAQREPKISRTHNSSRRRKRTTILGAKVTAAGMQLGDKLAKAIRRRVPWTRRATHDQLRWVCADMGEQRWTEDEAVRFVVEVGFTYHAGFTWTPDRPHALIAAGLRAHQEQLEADRQMQEDLAKAVAWEDSTAYRNLTSLAALFGPAQPEPKQERTDEDRRRARMDWNIWPQVLEHLEEDPDDAIDLYGERLCKFAISQQARLEGAWA